MAGGKGKNKKRKNNEGDPMSPPAPSSYRQEGGLPTPFPTPSAATATAALHAVTIDSDDALIESLRQKSREALDLAERHVKSNGVLKQRIKELECELAQCEIRGLEKEVELEKIRGLTDLLPYTGVHEDLSSEMREGIGALVEKWEKAEECWPEAEERVRKEYEGVVSAFDAERVGYRKELKESKKEVQSLREKVLEVQGARRAKMVDKGVRALPYPEVSSTLTQTDGSSGGLSWAGIAAKGSERGGSRPPSAPRNVGSEELAPKSGTVRKKSGMRARGLVVYGVSYR